MKILRTLLAVSVIGLASISSANARDSFSFGLNIGGYGPPPVVRYYSEPPVVYYGAPSYYYAPQPYYYGPRASFRYYDNDRHHRHHGWNRGHGHRDWDRGDHRGHRGRD
ncbi:MAG TPA: hypothetical protein VK967_06910 [Methylotenera sp.]|nr:hypothetical protein [Methylotenera sp.]